MTLILEIAAGIILATAIIANWRWFFALLMFIWEVFISYWYVVIGIAVLVALSPMAYGILAFDYLHGNPGDIAVGATVLVLFFGGIAFLVLKTREEIKHGKKHKKI